ncbi:MAG: Uma2 family endonuclease [Planctomycetes bacterium]|nr:Uma2 family endonuclease [Planctomycetota bacterium]
MATLHVPLLTQGRGREIAYPTRDGRPMGETDLHRRRMNDAIETLELYYEGRKVYVTGNILVFYEPGNRRKHVSPDVMVVKGVEPRERDNYLLWEERKAPNVVIEVTSKSTKEEDLDEKHEIYRDVIKVKEYFLFDPRSEYLDPPLQGRRLVSGRYVRIRPIKGRLPSLELGLHLEKQGRKLRFYDPRKGEWLLTPRELSQRAEAEWRRAEAERQIAEARRQQAVAEQRLAEARRQQADAERRQVEAEKQQAEADRQRAEAENESLRREIEALKRRLGGA